MMKPSSLGLTAILSVTALGCFGQFRRHVSTASILQSFVSLTGVLFYGGIISALVIDVSTIFLRKPPRPTVLPQKAYQPASSDGEDGRSGCHDYQRTPSYSADSSCPICLVDFVPAELISYGEQCGHCFHETCIQQCKFAIKLLHEHIPVTLSHTYRILICESPGINRSQAHCSCPLCRQNLLSKRMGQGDPKQVEEHLLLTVLEALAA